MVVVKKNISITFTYSSGLSSESTDSPKGINQLLKTKKSPMSDHLEDVKKMSGRNHRISLHLWTGFWACNVAHTLALSFSLIHLSQPLRLLTSCSLCRSCPWCLSWCKSLSWKSLSLTEVPSLIWLPYSWLSTLLLYLILDLAVYPKSWRIKIFRVVSTLSEESCSICALYSHFVWKTHVQLVKSAENSNGTFYSPYI